MKNRRGVALVVILAGASMLPSCASGARTDKMVPPPMVATRHAATASVIVEGGKETNPLWTSQISNESFAQAVRDALAQSGLFSAVRDSGGDYTVQIALLTVDQPMAGLSMTVDLLARWTLIATSRSQVVWSKDIASSHTAGMTEAFAGSERVRIAMEGAARENIRLGLTEIGRLRL